MIRMTKVTIASIAAAAPLAFSGCSGSADSDPPDPHVVQTQQGAAIGIEQSGVRQFLGLPYAAPPVGALRWKPPEPAAAYASGKYDASRFRSACMQGSASAPTGSEDCLYLNVYVPATATLASALPVLFWMHGGGFILGSGSQTDGSALAKQANAIVVTINYRLNALGFLAHPALSAEDPDHVSGDYGIMDQAAALGWVKQNIRAFGGDPANVTIFGDSAGGHSVYVQLASPLSAGLFAKAVAQSGEFSRQQESQAQAEVDGAGYANTWGCGNAATAACLRGLPAAALLQGNPATWYATLNTRVLPLSTSAAFASGNFNRVPIVSGFTQNEGTFFVASAFDAQSKPVTSDGYAAAIDAFLRVPGAATAAQYPVAQYATPSAALAAAAGDDLFVCGALQDGDNLARYAPAVYMYRFSDPAPYSVNSLISRLPPTGIDYGAFHSSDLDYWWQLIPSPSATQESLSGTMTAALAAFAHTGNPNAGGAPTWGAYSARARTTLDFGYPVTNTYDAYGDHHCGYWYGEPASSGL